MDNIRESINNLKSIELWFKQMKRICPEKADMYNDAKKAVEYAIAILKESETHIIPFKKLNDYETVWLEVKNNDEDEGLAPWVKTRSGMWFSPLTCNESIKEMHLIWEHDYNVIGRCWNARPTEEQRKKAKWEEKE